MTDDIVKTARLDLVPMTTAFLEASLVPDRAVAEQLLGVNIPPDWFDETWLMQLRLDQARGDTDFLPWLPRAAVLREHGLMIGYLNFHTAPDPEYLREYAPGAIEFGYTIFEPYRRRGYAQEATTGLMEWTNRVRGVRRFVLSISPDNLPSQRIAQNLGFVKIGQHIDEEDGPEDILERTVS